MALSLAKWDVLRVDPSGVGHTKFAVCLCPDRLWFFYINSEPPPGRKAAALAIPIEAFQARFLRKASYLDTAVVVDLPSAVVSAALVPDHHLGPLMPTLRTAVEAAVSNSPVLTDYQRGIILGSSAP